MRNHFVWALCGLLLSSCVSIKLPFESSSKAEKTAFNPPTAPFVSFVSDTADRAWISQNTGNTLSFLSECKSNLEEPRAIALDSVKAIENPQIQKQGPTEVRGRKSYEVVATGKVSETPVKLIITVINEGSCNYTLSYGGVEREFATELSIFENFKQGFFKP